MSELSRESASPVLPASFVALGSAACLVIIIAGLKAAGDVALPVLFSVFMAMLVWPMVSGMVRIGVPKGVAILLAMLVVAGAMVGGTAIVTDAMTEFTQSIPKYQRPLEAELVRLNDWLAAHGVGDTVELRSLVDPGSMLEAVRGTAGAVLGVLSNVLIVVITTAILLLEATELGTKLRVALGQHGGSSWLHAAGDRVQRYLVLKTIFSLVTGVLLGVWTAAMGLEFPVLWGLIAFVLNFIPAVGSIVAAVPPVILALVTLGPAQALAVAAGFGVVNVAIGNFLEPRVMGRRLGLSPFVVVLSLMFWGYVWGPGGMLIGVPMTVIAKLVLETSPSTRWIAILLGGADEAEHMSKKDATLLEAANLAASEQPDALSAAETDASTSSAAEPDPSGSTASGSATPGSAAPGSAASGSAASGSAA